MRTKLLPIALTLFASASFAQSTLTQLFGSVPHDFGRCCAMVGDWNHDGYEDFLVSSPREPNGVQPQAGAVRVYSGADLSVLLIVRGQANDLMGVGAAPAGDLDGDGVTDIVLGSPEYDGINPDTLQPLPNMGRVLAISGATGAALVDLTGRVGGDRFGQSVAGVGDLDGDGVDDIVVGAPGAEWNNSPFGAGVIQAWSALNGEIWLRNGHAAGAELGLDVTHTGDLDGDGHNEVVAAPVRILDGATGAPVAYLFNGTRVAGSLDFDRDGVGDFVVGWPEFAGGAGRVRVISGADRTTLIELFGSGDEGLGESVSVCTDVDADGFEDFVAGAPGWDSPTLGQDVGIVRVHSGRTGEEIRSFQGVAAGQRLGTTVSGSGDLNADGWPDLIASGMGAVYGFSTIPIGVTPIGDSTGGCVEPPRLMSNGSPTVGNQAFAVHSKGLAPNDVSFVVVSEVLVPAGWSYLGLTLYLDAPSAGGFISLVALLADEFGSVALNIPIPDDPGISGQAYALQTVSLFRTGPCPSGWVSTNGLFLQVP